MARHHARAPREGGPAGGRQTVGPLELSRHVTLVGETGLCGGFRQRLPAIDRSTRQLQPAQRPIAVGTRPKGASEVASKRETVGACDLLQDGGGCLLTRVGREVLARPFDRPQVERRSAAINVAAEPEQSVGDRDGDFGGAKFADRLVDVSEQTIDRAGDGRHVLDGICDERERATTEGAAHQLGRDVQDPVTEAVAGAGYAIVGFVWVQNVKLAGQADAAGAAIAKRLHPGRRDPDRVHVVPVRLEPMRGEEHFRALDPARARSEPDRVRTPLAGSFKTPGSRAL